MIDYCDTKVSVVARASTKVMQLLQHENTKVTDFQGQHAFRDFVKFLDKHGIKNSCGFNKNKKGYMETLKLIYELDHPDEIVFLG